MRRILEAVRRGETPEPETIRRLGEESPVEFFRCLIEPLCDSFDPAEAAAYRQIMGAFFDQPVIATPTLPEKVETVYVLSRVTLGADVKVASILLDAAKKRFLNSRVVFVGGRKSIELFSNDGRVEYIDVTYPKSGTVEERIAFAERLRHQMATPNSIVLDPDSRITQLGMVPVCEPERYFHLPSRTAGGGNLTAIAQEWTERILGVRGTAYVAPKFVEIDGESPWVTVSLGVGENSSKRLEGSFEADLIAMLSSYFPSMWIDRGAGGEEYDRVTEAASGHEVRFWDGSFAGFTSVIAQSDLFVGYDSAGQHAAAAVRTPLISVFAGAASPRFRERWAPSGTGLINIVDADTLTPEQSLAQIEGVVRQHRR